MRSKVSCIGRLIFQHSAALSPPTILYWSIHVHTNTNLHSRLRASNPPLWVGDQTPTSDTVKHNSACLGRTWRHDFTLWPCVVWIL